MSKLDYSKWDHIEISDDEDDTHPNIDTPSLFRWRHQARVERMEKAQMEKEEFQKGYTDTQQKLHDIKRKLKDAESSSEHSSDDLNKLKIELSELEKQQKEFDDKEEELRKKEKLTPLNIDTICHEGKSKTIINKSEPQKIEHLTEEEKFTKQQQFTKENEKLIKKYGMMKRYEDSLEMLLEHPQLACEETANYLVIWCINLEMEEKHDLMEHVAHQTISMQFILELAKSMSLDPRSCVRAFYSRMKLAEKQYMDAFNDELESFKSRIKQRAAVKLEEAMKEVEEEEKKKRLGPGGLDPVEVFEELPDVLKECFEKKDISLLQEAITKIPREEAEYYIKRCVDSGLWVPNAKDAEGDVAAKDADATEEEEIYETPYGDEYQQQSEIHDAADNKKNS